MAEPRGPAPGGRVLAGLAALALPGRAAAHGFGQLYNLPVPFWLYAWAAAAALVLSFAALALFTRAAPEQPPAASARTLPTPLRHLGSGLAALSLGVLLLSVLTALFGSRDPYRNFSMTAFWVVFVLAFTYLTALVGDVYARLNPWRVLAMLLGRLFRGYTAGRLRYPERLGEWPALLLYLGFIWFELFNHGRPFTLGLALLGYSLVNLAGVGLFGVAAWFRHGELFSVFLRLVGLMAPVEVRVADTPGTPTRFAWRWPFSGLLHARPAQLSTVLFVLAMLSTTAFDGLRATQAWVGLFWNDPTGFVTELAGARPIMAYPMLRPWYIAWETLCLLASPLLYFAAYALCIALGKGLTRSTRPLRELLLDFGYTVLPIALAYHLTHYAALLLTQGLKILSLVSDPFGWGWNLLGTAKLFRAPILPDMGLVWHTQVGLILAGHLVSVYLAHRIALRVWPQRHGALLSQLPMLVLMVAFTVFGLWILAQPLTAMLMR